MSTGSIRNFCIIAHIDHGKSTLADRLLEKTHTITSREFRNQMLDDMDLERERGITIKASAVALKLVRDGKEYNLNLIDTPGHVDFSYEVSRSLGACEGALLLVDASQGVEAQTVANAYLAMELNLAIIPVISKIDLPNSRPDDVLNEMEKTLGLAPEEALMVSAKTGKGIDEIFDAVIKRIPPPKGNPNAPLRSLIFDSIYDEYRGVVVYLRVFDGSVKVGDEIYMMKTNSSFKVEEVGIFKPKMVVKPAFLLEKLATALPISNPFMMSKWGIRLLIIGIGRLRRCLATGRPWLWCTAAFIRQITPTFTCFGRHWNG